MPDSTNVATITLLACVSALLVAVMLYPAALLRWFQRKRYQYEVTFSLYMLTSTEKFIFSTLRPLPTMRHLALLSRAGFYTAITHLTRIPDSVLFLLLSLLIIAASLYLPEHLSIIANRLSYYFSGNEESLAPHALKGAPGSTVPHSPLMPQGGGLAGQGRGFMEP